MPLDLPMKLPRVAAEQHQPECVGYEYLNKSPQDCIVCQISKQAYQRGREDAAKAVEQLEADSYGMIWNRFIGAAARGDSDAS